MNTKPSIGAGDVAITLDGESLVLRPSLAAALAISRKDGGIMSIVQACTRFDLDAIAFVVAQGLGRPASEVVELIFKTGIAKVAPPAITFCTILSNGGRPLGSTTDGGKDKGNA
jgi:hypothetical protein